ncbi:hypothetical protein BU24DRAFT_404338 [Aaosphaeria arxii CBS 175.79]|uniref:Uncharacterized protein n=1 Tax=Aaosphaeria arxii CBS 175.79 TaxID=1450172 RepID=A0A6A5Y7P7_9PLEO|nr:uncharacterized protein BU24DRAFT_404338 [Aaosphaeria arxii CBS 175.79]KAF2021319.1 hypothetical protein BU24DRAFT_404338 [Aaosphaeria arxii CBS 175.79]
MDWTYESTHTQDRSLRARAAGDEILERKGVGVVDLEQGWDEMGLRNGESCSLGGSGSGGGGGGGGGGNNVGVRNVGFWLGMMKLGLEMTKEMDLGRDCLVRLRRVGYSSSAGAGTTADVASAGGRKGSSSSSGGGTTEDDDDDAGGDGGWEEWEWEWEWEWW